MKATEPHFHAWDKRGTFAGCFQHKKDAEYVAGPDGIVRPYNPPGLAVLAPAPWEGFHELAKIKET